MAKAWYVLHVFSGYEQKIEKQIRIMVEDEGMEDTVLDIKVPSEQVVEVKNGKKKVTNKKFLPGYVLLEMDLPLHGWKAVCSKIRRIQGVTGFVGGDSNVKPVPISSEEARSILQKAGEIKGDNALRPKQSYQIGETIKIIEGPFETFTGTVEDINLEKSKLKVMVGIFGRATPVELDFLQVEKI